VQQDKKRLYVKFDVTSEQLKERFSAFGTVTDARLVPTGRVHPFAFVSFETEQAAAAALKAMQGQTLTTQPLTVEYAEIGRPRKPRRNRPAGGRQQKRQPKNAAAGDAAATSPSPAAAAASSPSPTNGSGGEEKKKKNRGPRKNGARKGKKSGEGKDANGSPQPATASPQPAQ